MLRLCLDLNVWVAALLADRKGRSNTGSQYLVEIVRSGSCPIGAVNLIVSLGMLDELNSVIVDHLGLGPEKALAYTSAIEEYAKLGMQLTLGGTGVLPMKDTEDAHVLETAIAGKADFIVTANFKDFIIDRDTKIEIPDRHAIYYSPVHSLQIIHPYLMVDLLKRGTLPKISNQYHL
jgi:predicted nucleic acid-binding protein